ncbi:MAG: D-hexose-6-phosphate mutarotase [Chloroflexota bacterium]
MSIEELNQAFKIENRLWFEEGNGGLPKVVIQTPLAEAELYIHGGHITHFQPSGHDPVLFTSAEAIYADGKAIRGGIPIIWPWFGAHPTDSKMPSHGFARRMSWTFRECSEDESGIVHLRLDLLEPNSLAHPQFDAEFKLELRISVGTALKVDLYTRNMSDKPFSYTAALHTYFLVGSITEVTLIGLDEKTYLDQLNAMTERIQQNPIQIDREIDRIYAKTSDTVFIHDPRKRRIIEVSKEGSYSTVIWNPWIEKSRRMPDFGDSEYQSMVCVEVANVHNDAIRLDSYQGHHLVTTIGASYLP